MKSKPGLNPPNANPAGILTPGLSTTLEAYEITFFGGVTPLINQPVFTSPGLTLPPTYDLGKH